MPALRVAFYARVSSDQQTEQGTIASQVAALEARILQDGLPLEPDHRFIDEGHSGATLIRPALEHLRDAVAAGTVDRVYVHSPDRLARRYAYQVLLIDEFRRLGVEIVFLNRAIGLSPEDTYCFRCKVWWPNTSVPRSWNAVGAANATPRIKVGSVFCPGRPMATAISANMRAAASHAMPSTKPRLLPFV